MATTGRQRQALEDVTPRDWEAAEKLAAMMGWMGLTAPVLGAQIGVSGKWIKEVVDNGRQPGPRIRRAIARRFKLMPGDIWRCDRLGLSPQDIEHLRALAALEDEREGVAA